jgi:hypothetical protein
MAEKPPVKKPTEQEIWDKAFSKESWEKFQKENVPTTPSGQTLHRADHDNKSYKKFENGGMVK